jgi:predicted metalloprotease with PDZ domain
MIFWRAKTQQFEVTFKEVDVEIAGQMGMVVAPDRFFHYVQHVLDGGLAQEKGVEKDAVLLAVNGVALSPLSQAEMEAAIHRAKYPKTMLFSKVRVRWA